MSKKHTNLVPFSSLEEATGALPFTMTNDYLFKVVLQENNHVLCELIRSLLHFPKEYEITAEIQNPIILGRSVENKEFILDIKVIVNHSKILNLEMQVKDELNWQNRSISYLSRSFDQTNHGQKYNEICPVIHIGFLDFTLFKNSPRFYSTYKLMETETHQIYSDNFDLRVLDLTQMDLATETDKKWQLDYWAALFKAKTWEELKAMANTNVFMDEACQTIFKMTADEWVQKCCYDREDYLASIASYQDLLKEKEDVITEGIHGLISTCMEFNVPREDIIHRIMTSFSLSREDAERYLMEYK